MSQVLEFSADYSAAKSGTVKSVLDTVLEKINATPDARARASDAYDGVRTLGKDEYANNTLVAAACAYTGCRMAGMHVSEEDILAATLLPRRHYRRMVKRVAMAAGYVGTGHLEGTIQHIDRIANGTGLGKKSSERARSLVIAVCDAEPAFAFNPRIAAAAFLQIISKKPASRFAKFAKANSLARNTSNIRGIMAAHKISC